MFSLSCRPSWKPELIGSISSSRTEPRYGWTDSELSFSAGSDTLAGERNNMFIVNNLNPEPWTPAAWGEEVTAGLSPRDTAAHIFSSERPQKPTASFIHIYHRGMQLILCLTAPSISQLLNVPNNKAYRRIRTPPRTFSSSCFLELRIWSMSEWISTSCCRIDVRHSSFSAESPSNRCSWIRMYAASTVWAQSVNSSNTSQFLTAWQNEVAPYEDLQFYSCCGVSERPAAWMLNAFFQI